MEPLPEPPPSPADAILSVCRQLADEKITLAEAVAHATTQRASLDKLDAELLSRLVGALCDGAAATQSPSDGRDALALAVECCAVDGVSARRCDARARGGFAGEVCRQAAARPEGAACRDVFRAFGALVAQGGAPAERLAGDLGPVARRAAAALAAEAAAAAAGAPAAPPGLDKQAAPAKPRRRLGPSRGGAAAAKAPPKPEFFDALDAVAAAARFAPNGMLAHWRLFLPASRRGAAPLAALAAAHGDAAARRRAWLAVRALVEGPGGVRVVCAAAGDAEARSDSRFGPAIVATIGALYDVAAARATAEHDGDVLGAVFGAAQGLAANAPPSDGPAFEALLALLKRGADVALDDGKSTASRRAALGALAAALAAGFPATRRACSGACDGFGIARRLVAAYAILPEALRGDALACVAAAARHHGDVLSAESGAIFAAVEAASTERLEAPRYWAAALLEALCFDLEDTTLADKLGADPAMAARRVAASCRDPSARVRGAGCRAGALLFPALDARDASTTDLARAVADVAARDADADAAAAACRALGVAAAAYAGGDLVDTATAALARRLDGTHALVVRAQAAFGLGCVGRALFERPAPLSTSARAAAAAAAGAVLGALGDRSADEAPSVKVAASALRAAGYLVALDLSFHGLADALLAAAASAVDGANRKTRRNACGALGVALGALDDGRFAKAAALLVRFLAVGENDGDDGADDRKALAAATRSLGGAVGRLSGGLFVDALRGAVSALRRADGDGPFPRAAAPAAAGRRRGSREPRRPDEPRQRAALFDALGALAAALLEAAGADAVVAADLARHLDFLYVWLCSRVAEGGDPTAVPRLLDKLASALAADGALAATLDKFAARARLLRRGACDDDEEL